MSRVCDRHSVNKTDARPPVQYFQLSTFHGADTHVKTCTQQKTVTTQKTVSKWFDPGSNRRPPVRKNRSGCETDVITNYTIEPLQSNLGSPAVFIYQSKNNL